MKHFLTFLFFTFLIIFGYDHTTSPDAVPQWVSDLIAKFEDEPVGNPPQSIWRYEYKGQIVYFIPPQCCDQFSQLYDEQGNLLGAPNGGITGAGDMQYTDFFMERKNEKLIWKDSRVP